MSKRSKKPGFRVGVGGRAYLDGAKASDPAAALGAFGQKLSRVLAAQDAGTWKRPPVTHLHLSLARYDVQSDTWVVVDDATHDEFISLVRVNAIRIIRHSIVGRSSF